MPQTAPVNSLARDANQVAMQLVPAVKANAVTYSTTISAAQDITLATGTTAVIVDAISQGVFVRFAATASSSNYDRFVQAGGTVMIPLPSGTTIVSVIQEAATAHVSVVEIKL